MSKELKGLVGPTRAQQIFRLSTKFIRGLFVLLVLGYLPAKAVAAERLALVIGNSKYANVDALPNPANDAKLIAEALDRVGYETQLVIDADRETMSRSIASYFSQIDGDTEAFIYFAGHGIQFNDENYLLPIDVDLQEASTLSFSAVSLGAIDEQIGLRKPKIAIIVLDACRNNPFPDTSSAPSGLAKTKGPLGTFIAFATAPGGVALDGTENNSPFSAALANYIAKPGLPVEQVFKRVRETVYEESGGNQVPWDNSSLVDDFFFTSVLDQAPKILQDAQKDAEAWKKAEALNTSEAYQAYAGSFPDGLFVDIANARAKGGSRTAQTGFKTTQKGRGTTSDLGDWNEAQSLNTAAAYDAYLKSHPEGLFAKLARLRREDLSAGDAGEVGGFKSTVTANYEEFAESPLYPEVTQCDHLAGHVQEAADPAVGVYFGEVEPEKAIPACIEALEQYPDSMRLLINYARAIDADGRHDEARELYRAGTEAGFPIAYRSLGDVYRDGRGVAKDMEEARYWYVLGANRNNVFAQLNLALIYEGGLGVEVNKTKAAYWLWRAGRQGFSPAMDKLADYFLKGEVVSRDERQAAILLASAAEMGNMWSQMKLGELYLKGEGVEKDPSIGKQWLEDSAFQGNKWAQARLATLYNEGVGVDADAEQALGWGYLAKSEGVDYLDGMITDLESRVEERVKLSAKAWSRSFVAKKIK